MPPVIFHFCIYASDGVINHCIFHVFTSIVFNHLPGKVNIDRRIVSARTILMVQLNLPALQLYISRKYAS